MTTDSLTRGTTVLSLIDEMTDSSPRSVAVRGPDGTVTYGELSVRAEQLARRLLQLGVKPGDLVGQCLERSVNLVVAALGIVRAGCAYVAIDPKYPDERMRWMLDDSGAAAVVTDVSTAPRLGADGVRRGVVLTGAGELRDDAVLDSADSLPAPPSSTDLAYVVYTSGSTGRPKGVMVEHAGLTNLVRVASRRIRVERERPLHPDLQSRL